jgi:centromeric protein E
MRLQLICTVTPASSSTEETHNTLKFAHRTKHVEIQASQNKSIDDNSLIKKYQKEILKRGMMEQPYLIDLADSESNKTKTTGLRRKEGYYTNKSLLTLGNSL